MRSLIEAKRGWKSKVTKKAQFWNLIKNIICEDYRNTKIIMKFYLEEVALTWKIQQFYYCWHKANLPPFSFFEDCNMTKYLTNIFLLWINVNRLCSHVGLEFWTPNSFMCPKLTIFTTWQFCFTTLYPFYFIQSKSDGYFFAGLYVVQSYIPEMNQRVINKECFCDFLFIFFTFYFLFSHYSI